MNLLPVVGAVGDSVFHTGVGSPGQYPAKLDSDLREAPLTSEGLQGQAEMSKHAGLAGLAPIMITLFVNTALTAFHLPVGLESQVFCHAHL